MASNIINVIKFCDIHGPKPCKLRRFGDMHGPKPCNLTRFCDTHGPKPFKFTKFGNGHGLPFDTCHSCHTVETSHESRTGGGWSLVVSHGFRCFRWFHPCGTDSDSSATANRRLLLHLRLAMSTTPPPSGRRRERSRTPPPPRICLGIVGGSSFRADLNQHVF